MKKNRKIYPLWCIQSEKINSTSTLVPLVMRFIRILRVLALQMHVRVCSLFTSKLENEPTKNQRKHIHAYMNFTSTDEPVCLYAPPTSDTQNIYQTIRMLNKWISCAHTILDVNI